MSRRRIAVITARADAAEQREILCGIAEAALSSDTDVVVYSNIYNHWTDDSCLNYENIIYSLFDPSYFDGVIITSEAFRDISVLDETINRIKKAKLPAVTVGGELEGFESVFSDDEGDMERIAEHLITVHGFTDIAILTGNKENADAVRRAKGCMRAFEKHNITFDENKLYYGSFWNDSGEELAKRYLKGEIPFPQAVICTNDYMAYGLCDTLTAAGVDIPEELTVTGYDNSAGGHSGGRIFHYPLLTTYRRNRRKMGRDAALLLFGEKRTDENTDGFISGNTCSCGAERSQLTDELNTERIGQYHTVMSSVAQFSSRLTMSRTLAEYTCAMSEFFYLLHGAERLYLCLDKAWNSGSFEGEEFLCCTIENGKCSEAPVRFGREKIPFPFSDEQNEPSMLYVSPVCFQTRLFGYTVLRYSYPTGYDFSFRDWCRTVADTLEFLRMKNDIHYLAQCQSASSMYDALTGFYNLREFRQIYEAAGECGSMYAVRLSFASDGEFLYGENFRSDIISSAAAAIKQACTEHEICCRAYEDIFLILCRKNDGVFSERLSVMLHNSVKADHDERRVLISCEVSADGNIEQLCRAVSEKNSRDTAELSERGAMPHYNALADIRSSIMKAPEKQPSLSQLSKQLCVSEGYFRSVYRQCFGISYNKDCINARLMKARYLLLTTAVSVYGAAVSCGYSDEKYFARIFGKNTGCSPMEYRKRFC